MVNAFVKSLEKFSHTQIALGSGAVGCAFAVVCTGYTAAIAKPCPTMNPEWQAATVQYLKFQKVNPMFGVSSKA